MAIAKQCDICGKVYKQYNNMDNPKKPNGLMLVNLDSESRTNGLENHILPILLI